MRHALAVLGLLVLGACGGSDDPAPGDPAAPAPVAPAPPVAPPPAAPPPVAPLPVAPPPGSFVVNEPFAASLEAKGVPRDAAAFFASARLESIGEEQKTYRFRQTFPNGATRDIEMRFVLDQTVAPTAEETAAGARIFASRYSTSKQAGTVENRFQYFVPYSEMPAELRALLAVPVAAGGREKAQADGGGSGAYVHAVETAKTGADVSISSLIDYFKDQGFPLTGELLGNIFALASALDDIAGAALIGLESNNRQAELDVLEYCALNPTNPLSKSDPSYSAATAARVAGAKSELAQVNAVRILNILTETSIGLDPKLAGLGILLKSGFTWNEETLGQYAEDTIMREARNGVVPCRHPFNAVVTFQHARSYDLCDDICHHYDNSTKANATMVFRATPHGVYVNDAPSIATISLRNSDDLTDGRALNPPYRVSRLLTADSSAMTVSAGGGPVPPVSDAVAHDPHKVTIDFEASARVTMFYVGTDVGYVNGVVTTTTTSRTTEEALAVRCRFEDVNPSIGGESVGIVQGPLSEYSTCKMSVTPIKPS